MSGDTWIYSENEELYWELSDEFDSKEDAIESAKEDEEIEGTTIFVGRKIPARIEGINVDTLLEEISINTTQGLDGFGEDFLMNVSREHFDELESKLNDVFFEWMKKNEYDPDWFEVIDIELVDLTK